MKRTGISRLAESVVKSEIFRNSAVLISGTALAQLIPVLLQPILRRVYASPEMFGTYSVYSSLTGILLIISSFKYELAIIQPRERDEAANVFFLTIIINFIFNFFLFLIILVFKNEIVRLLNINPTYSSYIYLVPLGTFLYSLYQSINYWLIREKNFYSISVNKFVRRGFEGFSQMTLSVFSKSWGVLLGDIIGHISNVISGFYQVRKSGPISGSFSYHKIKKALLLYSEYPKFSIIPSFMSACSFALPAIMINKYYSAELNGYFDFARQLLLVPVSFIGIALSNVLLQRISEKYKERLTIKKDLLSVSIFVLFAAILEIFIIMVWGEDIFRLFFGEQWISSGVISKVLVWSFAANFIVSSFSSIFISLNEIKIYGFWQLLYFISILSLFLFVSRSFDSFLLIYVSIEISCLVLLIILMIWIVRNYEKKIVIAGHE